MEQNMGKQQEDLFCFQRLFTNLVNYQYNISELDRRLRQFNQLTQLTQFQKACMDTKLKIVKMMNAEKNKIKEEHLETLCEKLKVLDLNSNYLIQEGLINLYIDVYDEKKRAKKIGNKDMGQVIYKLMRCLQGLIKHFFLENQLKHFRKYKHFLPPNILQDLQNQKTSQQQKIKQRILTKKCGDLFKQYLKNQIANQTLQLCRICYKQVEVTELVKHADFCTQKTLLKQQLSQNFQNRLNIVFYLQQACQTICEYKMKENILKITEFYKNLKKHKNKSSRRFFLRYKDKNFPLFFHDHQMAYVTNKQLMKLINQLSSLEDKAFCLVKKLQQLQSASGFKGQQIKNSGKVDKGLPQIIFKKSQSNQYQNNKFSKLSRLSINISHQKYLNNYSNNQGQSFQEIQQQNEQLKQPIIIQRKFKKKRTQSSIYSIRSKSDSNPADNCYSSLSINNFEILKLLGKGAFGRVYLVRRRKTRDIYALKAIKIDQNWGEQQLQAIRNEYGIYKKIAGDHLVTATFSFRQKNVQFFVLQFMPGGDLSKFLQLHVYLQQKYAKFYLAQILLAIEHLHSSQIIHRDLKPENIVLDSKGHLKLTDFGLSQFRVRNKIQKALQKNHIQEEQQTNLSSCTNKRINFNNRTGKKIIGTPDYIAPEVIEGTSLVNPTIDWWSFGVIAYQMLIGCRPFSANTIQDILSNIQKGEIQLPEVGDQDNMISSAAASFITNLLKKNFKQRLGFNGIQQIKSHEFFKGINWQMIKNTNPPLQIPNTVNNPIQFMDQDKNLRKQIQILIGSETENTLHELKNYVRYDLLTAQTLESVKNGAVKKQRHLRKLRSITANFDIKNSVQNFPNIPSFSSQDQIG